jgi:DNA-directed RNA polymerase specialized sigma24 family protein
LSIAIPLRYIICHGPPDSSKFGLAHLQALFARTRETLLLVARKVLDDDEGASEVVANCFARACQRSRTFADEAELRRWLVRLAIDEALLVVSRKQ